MNLICYLSNGYPAIEDSVKMAQEYVDAGCDIIEIDFPSHNPYLESEFIADRMAKALENCADFDKYMEGMIKVKNLLPNTKFILMVYENTVEEIGVNKFTDFCVKNGFVDLILVGIKDESIKNALIEKGMRVSCYVQLALYEDEVQYALKSNGFVYLQAKADSDKYNPQYPTLKDCINFLKDKGLKNPIYCGVGVHTPDDAEMVKNSGGDGIFVGSAILKLHNDLPKMKQTISDFKAKC